MPEQLQHDPSAKLDYSLDWSTWLKDGDTITASTWTAPADITLSDDTLSGSTSTVWVAGGSAGKTYSITNHITTSQGREDDRSISLRCVNR